MDEGLKPYESNNVGVFGSDIFQILSKLFHMPIMFNLPKVFIVTKHEIIPTMNKYHKPS